MSVERRYQKRMAVNLPVRVDYREQERIIARAQNLSAEGMYLSGGGPRVPSGMVVSLRMFTGELDWQIEALVVHSDSPGIGVLFLETQHRLYTELAARRTH